MKRIRCLLLIVVCVLLVISSCGGGKSRQKVLPIGTRYNQNKNVSYMVTNNREECRIEVDFVVEKSADAWFSVTIESRLPETPGWRSDSDDVPPVKITDSNGRAIV